MLVVSNECKLCRRMWCLQADVQATVVLVPFRLLQAETVECYKSTLRYSLS